MTTISRRDALRTAAWCAPLIALAVAAPAAAASNVCTNLYDFNPKPNDPHNRVRVTIANATVTFTVIQPLDSVDFNIRWLDGTTKNHHPNRGAAAGEVFAFPIPGGACDVKWIQSHRNNTYYYGGGVFA